MFSLLKFKEVARAIPESTYVNHAIPEGTTLEQLRTELLGLMSQENTNHHRMGEIYNSIVEKKLAEKAGYKDARDYLSKHLADLSQATLTRYGAVAAAFSEPVARRFGVTCLNLLLGYKEAADVEVNREEPGPTPIEVPDEKGHVTTKPFSACSVEELRQALQRKRKPASSKPLPPEAEARAEQYSEAVAGRFPKGQGTRVTVEVRNQKGKAVLDFKGIPLEQVGQLAEALAGELPPVNAVSALGPAAFVPPGGMKHGPAFLKQGTRGRCCQAPCPLHSLATPVAWVTSTSSSRTCCGSRLLMCRAEVNGAGSRGARSGGRAAGGRAPTRRVRSDTG